MIDVRMAAGPDETEINVSDIVSECDTRQAGISWPLPVDMKLEQLLRTARAAGERTSRREIAAAIVAVASDFDGPRLSKLLKEYRLATVGQVLKPANTTNVISFTGHGPGPRRRGA
jgi:hypothetical protein